MNPSPTLDDIYDACNRLDGNGGQQNSDYSIFLAGTKSHDSKVKKLSAQMIVRYWNRFTDQRNTAFASLVSLLEDPDIETRKSVIREMSHLVKADELADKIADVLSQMLQQTDEPQEVTMLTVLLIRFLKSYPKDVLLAIFGNVVKSDEESIRIRLLGFLGKHLPDIPTTLLTDELKKLIEEQFREILKDVTAAEFDIIFNALRSMDIYKTVKGRITLYKIVVEQIGIDQPFPFDDVERCDQILYFVERAFLLLSHNCRSTDLVNFLISGLVDLRTRAPVLRNRYLRALADLIPFAGIIDEQCCTRLLIEFVHLIPLMPSEQTDADGNALKEKNIEQELKLNEIEALGIALSKTFQVNKNAFEKIRELDLSDIDPKTVSWQKRLVYLANLLQQYISSSSTKLKRIRETPIANRDKEMQKFLENSLVMAENSYKVTRNLVHRNPNFVCPSCSWRLGSQKDAVSPLKRTSLDANDPSQSTATEKKGRPSPDFYVPPSGKYSNVFGSNVNRGMRRGGRGMQGRRGRF